MSNYNVTRFFRSARHSLKGGSISFFLRKHMLFWRKLFFFIILTKIFKTQKILKMKNKHPEHFWSALNSISENKKNLIFEIL
jgi:hypothetical protein